MTKSFTAEYGSVPDSELSVRTVLAKATGAFKRPYELIHKTAGYEIAGSCLRLTGEAWGSLSYDRNGTTHGQWFKTLAEARAQFEQFTTPVIEVKP